MEFHSSVNSERLTVRSSAHFKWICLTHCSRFYEEASSADISVVSPKIEMAILWLGCHVITLKTYTALLVAQLVKNPPAMQETLIWFLGQEDPLERDRLPTPEFLGFSCGSAGKESTCNVGDLGSVPRLGRSLEKGTVTHSSTGLENFADCIVHDVTRSRTRLSDFH